MTGYKDVRDLGLFGAILIAIGSVLLLVFGVYYSIRSTDVSAAGMVCLGSVFMLGTVCGISSITIIIKFVIEIIREHKYEREWRVKRILDTPLEDLAEEKYAKLLDKYR